MLLFLSYYVFGLAMQEWYLGIELIMWEYYHLYSSVDKHPSQLCLEGMFERRLDE